MRRQYLMDLPVEILLFGILLRLPAKSLCCLRCVSKVLSKTVDNPSFLTSRMRLLTDTNNVAETPQLMHVTRRIPIEDQLLPTVQSLNYDARGLTNGKLAFDMLTPGNYSVRCIFYNLFILNCNNYHDFLLFNPLRGGEVLRLPRSEVIFGREYDVLLFDWLGMGFDNISNTHKIVRVSGLWSRYLKQNQRKVVAQVLVLGTNIWRQIESVPNCSLIDVRNVCAYGDVHMLVLAHNRSTRKEGDQGEGTNSSVICSFDIKKEEFYWTPHPTLQASNEFVYLNLLTIKGSMAIVDTYPLTLVPKKGIEIWVLKDYAKKTWTKDYNIMPDPNPNPSYMLEGTSTCGEWEHGIFFKRPFGDSDHVMFLDLRPDSVNRMNRVKRLGPREGRISAYDIVSYTDSFMSLKNYGSLVEGYVWPYGST